GTIAQRTEKRRPGYGFMQQDGTYVGDKANTVGQMMIGNNSGCDATKASDSARQTVNYASCHDNYSLFDQFSGTLSTAKGFSICRAVTATNVAIMMGNGVAFMQGGEELFRTKIVSDEDAAKIRLPEDYVTINGIKIAHNAYKCSDATNAYDYSRKISVTYGDEECTCCKLYFDRLAAVIKLRSSLVYKAGPGTSGDPSYWNTDNGSTQMSYFIGTGGTSGYALLLAGSYAGNSQTLSSGNTYTEFAYVGSGTLSGTTVTSNECYSALVTKQN
ncbi:MAG: hypothetical protein K5906_04360, partial [Bacilli bacterium]|nr:hypothetical protein [Bacilli bacterium]